MKLPMLEEERGTEATLGEWAALFESAVTFKKLKSWQWLAEEHIFGVQNPETGQIGYCCVVGHGGESFGMNVFLGSEGLQLVKSLYEGEPPSYESIHKFWSLTVNFESRKDLDPGDVALIKELGLKFRGANEWPIFRNYKPGYVPFYLNGEEVRFLTTALDQAAIMAVRTRNSPDLLAPTRNNAILVRVQEMSPEGAIRWEDKWIVPDTHVAKAQKTVFPDELRLRRAGERATRKLGVWEADLMYAPFPVDDQERPYYPRMGLIADQESGYIVNFYMFRGVPDDPEQFLTEFVRSIEEVEGKPHKLLVRTSECADLFEHTARQLKIKLERAPRLFSVEEAWESMAENM